MITLELFEHWLAQAPAGHQLIILQTGSVEVVARHDAQIGPVYQRALQEQQRGRILLEANAFGTCVAIMRQAQTDRLMVTHELPQVLVLPQPIQRPIPKDTNFAGTNYDMAEDAR